ncbi:suppressor APC domain-containing protein 2 isoform X2 [Brachyhypopomus gauderio]|uniref:suppressor APC domain-containing protein 2 isoform X2 n=1 Tax=Brachyhypopomus gauderio TaxID=698409 RepID=UPI0040426CC2
MALVASDPNCERSGLTCGTGIKREGVQSRARGLKITNMQPKETVLSTEALPKAFLHSLRTLFDILDDERRGYVHISEIESRWQGSDTQDLPGCVLDCLRRVTPTHGCLTFERFVAGLRFSMLNPENSTKSYCSNNKQNCFPNGSKPQPQQTHSHKTGGCALGTRPYEGHIRPLGPSNGTNMHHSHASSFQSRTRHHDDTSSVYTISSKLSTSDSSNYADLASTAQRYSSGEYERTGRSLERIHVCRSDSVRVGKKARHPNRVRSIESLALESSGVQKQSPQGKQAGFPRSQSETTTGFTGSRRQGWSQEEQRRHTITNGVDYEMLKQMKELEQEKDSLLAGLDVVERAREWYQSQIHNVTERQRLVGQSSHCSDFMMESGQNRLNILLPKLQEVSCCLNDLISCSGMALASASPHGSSIAPSGLAVQVPPQAIQRLKDQNRLLTQEVTEKSERITQLQQEKSALIKQLFEARARSTHDSSALDSTFI